MRKSKSSICLAVIAGIALMAGFARPQKTHRINAGVWGGEHIQLDVNSDSAAVEFDCAHGTIEGPLATDENGEFSWKGRFARERGGPVRRDESDTSQPAVYSGSIKHQTMRLVVQLENDKEPLDTFVLVHGKDGRIRKCR